MGKKLGQHFLRTTKTIKAVVDVLNIDRETTIVEIGPGKGAMTKYLIEKNRPILAIEKDPNLVEYLKEKFSDVIEKDKLTILQEDIRNNEWRNKIKTKKYVIIANIPYYLTGALIRDMLTSAHPPQSMALVMQKEVAERIIKRESKESLLSLSVQLFGTPRYIQKISKSNFSPPPSVDSALITITKIHSVDKKFEKIFFDMVSQAFKEKRKTVLKKFNLKKDIQNLLIKNNISEKERAENIPFEVWENIAQKIFKLSK